VALYNSAMDELFQVVNVGTPFTFCPKPFISSGSSYTQLLPACHSSHSDQSFALDRHSRMLLAGIQSLSHSWTPAGRGDVALKGLFLNAWIRQTVALVLLVPLLTAGCAGVTQWKMNEEGLREAVVKFNDALRWRDFQHAILWVAFPQQEDFWRQTEALQDNVRIIEYQIQRLQFDAMCASGSVTVRYRFYKVQNPQLQFQNVQQRWQYFDQEANWRIVQFGLGTFEEGRF